MQLADAVNERLWYYQVNETVFGSTCARCSRLDRLFPLIEAVPWSCLLFGILQIVLAPLLSPMLAEHPWLPAVEGRYAATTEAARLQQLARIWGQQLARMPDEQRRILQQHLRSQAGDSNILCPPFLHPYLRCAFCSCPIELHAGGGRWHGNLPGESAIITTGAIGVPFRVLGNQSLHRYCGRLAMPYVIDRHMHMTEGQQSFVIALARLALQNT